MSEGGLRGTWSPARPGERGPCARTAGPASLITSLASFDQRPQAASEASGEIFDGTPRN